MPMGTETGENQTSADLANQQTDNGTNDVQNGPVDNGYIDAGDIAQSALDKAENGEPDAPEIATQENDGIPIDRNLNRENAVDDAAFVAEAERRIRGSVAGSESSATVREDNGMERNEFPSYDQDRTAEELQEVNRMNDSLGNSEQTTDATTSHDAPSSAVDAPDSNTFPVAEIDASTSNEDSGSPLDTAMQTGTNEGDYVPTLPQDDSLDTSAFDTMPVDSETLTGITDAGSPYPDIDSGENPLPDNATDSSIYDYNSFDTGNDQGYTGQYYDMAQGESFPESVPDAPILPEITVNDDMGLETAVSTGEDSPSGYDDAPVANDAVSVGDVPQPDQDTFSSGNPEDNETSQIASEGDPVSIENQPVGIENLDHEAVKNDAGVSLPPEEIGTPQDLDTSNTGNGSQDLLENRSSESDGQIDKGDSGSRGNGSSFEATTEAGLADVVQGIRTDGIDGLADQMQNMFPDDYTPQGFADTIQDGLSQLESQVDSEDPSVDISRDAIDNAQNDAADFMGSNDIEMQQIDVDNEPDPFDADDQARQMELGQDQDDTDYDRGDPAFVEDLRDDYY